MAISAEPLPIFSDNYAWLLRDAPTGATAVVDPADAVAVERAIRADGGRLDLILLTHHHSDHVAGTDAVRAAFGCSVIGAAADANRLPRLDRGVREGETIVVGNSHATVIETPGHTRGHVAFFFPGGPLLLCGDTLFSLGCGRLLEGTAAELFASLRKLAALPAETSVCCGHEYTQANARFALSVDPDNAALQARAEEVAALRAASRPTLPSRLSGELAANPFLRAPDVATFADLRARKDLF
jgi:hydroxyacylglutathione hydrolase